MSNVITRGAERSTTSVDEEVARPVLDFLDDVNAGELDSAVGRLAADAVHHGGMQSYRPEGVKVLFALMRELLPDMRLEARSVRVVGDQVVTRVVGTGTHTGSFLGRRPTGRPIVWESFDIARVRRGADGSAEISARQWDVFSDPHAWQEIGVIPAIMC